MLELKPAQMVATLDDYLNRICELLQLSATQFEVAEARYHSVGEWLIEVETPLDQLKPDVFAQGSMLQRTTIRPMRLEDKVVPFDLDSVCCCEVDPESVTSQSVYLSIRHRLERNETYSRLMAVAAKDNPAGGKCIRLAYTSDDFYLDVVPACRDPSDPEGIRLLIAVPSKWSSYLAARETWCRTDPLRFAAWLQARTVIGRRASEASLNAKVSPIPPQEPSDTRAPLRRVIQLLKRFRDIEFLGEDCRPTSILLSTLAGRHYAGESSITKALEVVLDGIAAQIDAAAPHRIVVSNPADEIAPHLGGVEDLAEPLTDEAYAKFCVTICGARQMLANARKSAGIQRLYPVLSKGLGPKVVREALASLQDDVARANDTGLVGLSTKSLDIQVLSEPRYTAGVRPIATSTFHLDDRS